MKLSSEQALQKGIEFQKAGKATTDIPTQSNILDEFKLDKAFKLAKKKIKDGLSEEAKKIYQDIIKKFPKNKKALNGDRRVLDTELPKGLYMQPTDGKSKHFCFRR